MGPDSLEVLTSPLDDRRAIRNFWRAARLRARRRRLLRAPYPQTTGCRRTGFPSGCHAPPVGTYTGRPRICARLLRLADS